MKRDHGPARWRVRAGLVFVLLGLTACATPVGVRPMDAEQVHEELTRSALSSRGASRYTLQVLQRASLRDLHRSDPRAAVAALRETIDWDYPSDRLFALAELSFHYAEWSHRREHYIAAAAYAWAFLFPGDEGTPPDRYDPRLRLAMDLYNRGVAEGLTEPVSGDLHLGDRVRELPADTVEIDFDEATLRWAGYRLGDFRDAAKLDVRGLRNRYRVAGIGAPLIATPRPVSDAEVRRGRLLPTIQVPVTALLRFEDARQGLRRGHLRACLELFTQHADSRVAIQGREVPLEYESSSAFAATLSNDLIWDFEARGFFRGDFIPFAEASAGRGLFFVHPYVEGKIPVVFVHGTASSPGRWADPVNELLNSAALREHYQPWLFMYNTGQPIAYSAAILRSALQRALRDIDPDGSDPALRRMVVIGHSQGGLLTKLLVTSSGDRFWSGVSSRPIEELDLDPEVRDLLRRSLFFEPQPFVERVVFLCTPHRGSYLAAWRVSYWLRRFIRLPTRLAGALEQLVARNPEAVALRSLSGVPSSLDNMTPRNPFLRKLVRLPIAPGVHAHSIVAVRGDGPVETGDDGVVKYTSAHLDDVDSEKVVRSGHSAQAHPETLRELGRILRLHRAEAE